MPAPVTHYLQVMSAKKELEKYDIHLDESILFLGAIFPDLFYFGHYKISNQIHNEGIEKFYRYLIGKRDLFNKNYYSFLVGSLGHMYADTSCHPYIYYKTGVYRKGDKSTKKYRSKHMDFEMCTDAFYTKQELKKQFRKFKVYKLFKKIDEEFIEQLEIIISEYFNEPAEIAKHYNRLQTIYRKVAYDPYGVKKVFYKFLDLFSRNRNVRFQDASQFNRKKPDLNENKKLWFHPCTREERVSSFDEMLQESIQKLIVKSVELDKYFKGELNEINIPNDDFDTGMPCSDKHNIDVFEF